MKRLRDLKMTILLMAITGIFGFANVSAVEKYPNKIYTEQDIRRSLNNKKALNNKKDLLAKLEDLKKWREIVKGKQNTKNKEDLLDQLNEYIGDFEFFFDSLEDYEYDDAFYKEKVELYENVKNNVKRFLNINLKESVSNNNLNYNYNQNYNRNFAVKENKNSKEKFLKNKAKLLKNFDELKRWRDMVKEKQNTNDFAKKELLKRLDFRINCSKDCLNSLEDEEYDDIYCGQENNIHKNFEKIVGEYLGINLKENVSNNNLNYNHNQNFAMNMKENKNSKKKFLNNKRNLFSKLIELKNWIDSEKEKMKRMNLSNEKNRVFKKIDDIIKQFETSLKSLKDRECDDIFYKGKVKLYDYYKNRFKQYLEVQYKQLEDEYKKRIEKYSNNKRNLFSKLKELKDWIDSEKKRMNLSNEKNSAFKKIDDRIKQFETSLKSLKDRECDDIFCKGQVKSYNDYKIRVGKYLKIRYKQLEDEYKKRIEKYSNNKKDIRKKLEDVRKWRIKVFENQDTNEEKGTLLKKIDGQIESFDVCLGSIEDKEFDDDVYKQFVEAYEYVEKEVIGYLRNINKGKGPSRKIKPEKIDKKDINQSKKIDKKDINQDINSEKGNKEVPVQKVNINDKQYENKNLFEETEKYLQYLLFYLRRWKYCIMSKEIVLKDGKEKEILEQINKNIEYYETMSKYLYVYKEKIITIKRIYNNILKDFAEFVTKIRSNLVSGDIA